MRPFSEGRGTPSFGGRLRVFFIAVVPIMLMVALFAKVVVAFVIQTARVDGNAMEPTFSDQQRLFVNKWAYVVGVAAVVQL